MTWAPLYRIGGVAALLSGLLFRRNRGVEIELFVPQSYPVTVDGWYTLLQDDRLLGLGYLDVFDLVNHVLVGVMFLALYVLLWRVSKSYMTIATVFTWVGITVYFVSNAAFSMWALSEQYAAATSEAERTLLLAARQALLAGSRFGLTGATPARPAT